MARPGRRAGLRQFGFMRIALCCLCTGGPPLLQVILGISEHQRMDPFNPQASSGCPSSPILAALEEERHVVEVSLSFSRLSFRSWH